MSTAADSLLPIWSSPEVSVDLVHSVPLAEVPLVMLVVYLPARLASVIWYVEPDCVVPIVT
ncbi:hypothetical protein UK12_33760, partial [Saccharothrix sp. ST-888]